MHQTNFVRFSCFKSFQFIKSDLFNDIILKNLNTAVGFIGFAKQSCPFSLLTQTWEGPELCFFRETVTLQGNPATLEKLDFLREILLLQKNSAASEKFCFFEKIVFLQSNFASSTEKFCFSWKLYLVNRSYPFEETLLLLRNCFYVQRYSASPNKMVLWSVFSFISIHNSLFLLPSLVTSLFFV